MLIPALHACSLLVCIFCLSATALVERLNEVRDEDPSNRTTNRVDTMLADVFSLLSLFFLRIGKGREAPATYSQIASIWVRRLSFPRFFVF